VPCGSIFAERAVASHGPRGVLLAALSRMALRIRALLFVCLGVLYVSALVMTGSAFRQKEKPTVAIPQPGVPQIMTIEGAYVRAAYNNEGYVILGYRAANNSIGDEWMLLEIGATLREGRPNYKLMRDHVSLEVPDGQKIPLASVEDFRAANLTALRKRNEVMRDSINYFPPMAHQACRIGFFSELNGPVLPWDQVELSYQRGCLGQMFFKVPGGIKYGQHWLDVKFAESLVRVPFRILTKEEDKMLNKNYGDIKKQIEAAFKPPKKK